MMNKPEVYFAKIKEALEKVSSEEKASSMRRYFPDGINCIGAKAPDIKLIIHDFQTAHPELSATDTLCLTEYILAQAEFNEEVLIAFGLINKFVKKHYDDELLLRFEFWLEHYATNWAHVDDLCIKTIFGFLMSRPHLIEQTQSWPHSKVPWCRRASNLLWVKFIKRKIGKSTYYLDKKLIFANCDLLINDKDIFVQKSIGWLLKVAVAQHQQDVIAYIEHNLARLKRPTIRYAIEKMNISTRQRLLSLS
jgi:3-methyladenine DNA glycosylase AlkD